jgi:rubrerythrin
MRKLICAVAALVVLTAAASSAAPAAPAIQVGSTLENLQAAYNGESNAHAKYLAFAQKAAQEGYGEIASLFRAAARAEQIHAGNHAAIIKKLGGAPQAKIQAPTVKSTKENLAVAIEGESYERDVMYPAFIQKARQDANAGAVRTFTLAKTAEAGHADLYADALKNAEQRRAASKTYQVCTVCGLTVAKIDFSKCPSCFSPKEKYEAVS